MHQLSYRLGAPLCADFEKGTGTLFFWGHIKDSWTRYPTEKTMAPATTDFWQILLASEWTLSHPIREAKQNACMSLSKFCEDPLKPLPFGVMKHTQLRNPHQRGRCLMAKSSKPCRTNFWNYQQTMFDYQRVRWFLVVFFIFTRSLVLYGFVLFLLGKMSHLCSIS